MDSDSTPCLSHAPPTRVQRNVQPCTHRCGRASREASGLTSDSASPPRCSPPPPLVSPPSSWTTLISSTTANTATQQTGAAVSQSAAASACAVSSTNITSLQSVALALSRVPTLTSSHISYMPPLPSLLFLSASLLSSSPLALLRRRSRCPCAPTSLPPKHAVHQ